MSLDDAYPIDFEYREYILFGMRETLVVLHEVLPHITQIDVSDIDYILQDHPNDISFRQFTEYTFSNAIRA